MLNENSTKDEILSAFEQYGLDAVLTLCPERLKSSKALMQIAVEYDGLVLAHASAELRDDAELVLTAIEQPQGWAVFFASRQIKRNLNMQKAIYEINFWAYNAFIYPLIMNTGTSAPEYNGDLKTSKPLFSEIKKKKNLHICFGAHGL